METTIMNIAKQNAETVRRGYGFFNTGNMKELAELFQKNASWHTPGKTSIAGSRNGLDAVFAQFGRYGEETRGTFKAVLKDVAMCDDGTIITLHHNSGERNGKKLNVDCCIVFKFQDGKVAEGKEFFFDLHAWDAFWS